MIKLYFMKNHGAYRKGEIADLQRKDAADIINREIAECFTDRLERLEQEKALNAEITRTVPQRTTESRKAARREKAVTR